MHQLKLAAIRAAAISIVLMLPGCGGGGGRGGSQNPPPPPARFTVGGTVSGLAGTSLALRLNGGTDLPVNANGNFTFPATIANGSTYTVTVQTQPIGPSQTCTLANATGNISANVTNVAVTCTTNTYLVRGALSGLAGANVVLRNNGGDDLTLAADGGFQFATRVPSGDAYAVTVHAQPTGPWQVCGVSQGSGNVAAADVTDVAVNCTTSTFSVGGTVAGLAGAGLVLRNNGGDDLAVGADGAFTFAAPVVSGGGYLVSVHAQPANRHCSVAGAGGTVLGANIASVVVTCVPVYSIGGTVQGLDVAGLALRNSGGDDLTVAANGDFTFATRVPQGEPYLVTAVGGTPASPRHVCQVVNGAGFANADVANVEVTCEADRFAYVAHSSTTSFNGPGLISALVMNHETGALSPIAGTSTFPNANGAVQIVSDPRGRFVYVAHDTAITGEGLVSGFSVNPATGALTPVPGSPFASGMATSSLAIDSEGWFLYASNSGSNSVSGWTIQPDGSLVPVPGSPYYLGDAASPRSIATTPAHQCCYVYVAHNNINGVPQVSAFEYDDTTGALTVLPGSPFSAGLDSYSPASIVANLTGEFVYVANSGTSNLNTFDLAGGAGTLTQRAGSPTPVLNSPCYLHQPRLSPWLFVVSSLGARIGLYGDDPDTYLPAWVDDEMMFPGEYCSVATDAYGQFAYVPKFDDVADYLFGFRLGSSVASLEPLTLNPLPPTNTYTLSAQKPRSMVIRYSRRDREMLQVTE